MIPAPSLSSVGVYSNFGSTFGVPTPSMSFSLIDLTPNVSYDQLDAAKNVILNNDRQLKSFFGRSIYQDSLSNLDINAHHFLTPDQKIRIKFSKIFKNYTTRTMIGVAESDTVVNERTLSAPSVPESPDSPPILPEVPPPPASGTRTIRLYLGLLYDTTGSNWNRATQILPSHIETIRSYGFQFRLEPFDVRRFYVGIASQGDLPISPFGGPDDKPFDLNLAMTPADQVPVVNLTSFEGADGPEAQLDAIIEACNTFSWGTTFDSVNLIVNFTDTDPHEGPPHATRAQMQAAVSAIRGKVVTEYGNSFNLLNWLLQAG